MFTRLKKMALKRLIKFAMRSNCVWFAYEFSIPNELNNLDILKEKKGIKN
ncbi:hypothetical protein [Lactiplantibacillus plantarum]